MESTESGRAEGGEEMTATTIAFIALAAGACLISYLFGARRGMNELRIALDRNAMLIDENANLRARLEDALDQLYTEAFGG